jgi:hypothetical protein
MNVLAFYKWFYHGLFLPTKYLELVTKILKLQYTFKKNGAAKRSGTEHKSDKNSQRNTSQMSRSRCPGDKFATGVQAVNLQ